MLGIGRDREHGLGRCLKQQIVDHRLVGVGDVFGDFKSCPHLPASLLIGFDDAASLDRSQNSVDYNERQGNGYKCTQKTRHVY